MQSNLFKAILQKAVLAVTILLAAAGVSSAQTTAVNLTARRMSTTLPDGTTVPMWGFCTTGSCTNAWAPGPTITVPAGSNLTINLTNNLPAPTSLVILGQLGGGLGSPAKVPSPAHPPSTMTTWPANVLAPFNPPAQGPRVQSFGTERISCE